MNLKNTGEHYGNVTKTLHWTISILVIVMLILGALLDDIPKPLKFQMYTLHKSIGISILGLMAFRLVWRLINPRPVLPNNTPNWEKWFANGSHAMFYILLIAMPLTGWIMSTASGHIPDFFWLVKFPLPFIAKNKPLAKTFETIHTYIAWSIVALLCLHVMGALKHHFIDKDNVLTRMLPNRK